jgi:hypothetical protein
MMNKYLSASLAVAALTVAVSAPAQAAGLTALNEGFANVSGLAPAWTFTNNSDPAPLSPAPWSQGVTTVSNFAAQAGPANSFAQVSLDSTSGDPITQDNGTISNWLITPELDFSAGGTFSFFARTFGGNDRPELIQVYRSDNGASSDVGTTGTSLGDFTTLVGSVGSSTVVPGLATSSWTKFTFNLAASGGSGKLGFRYFATNGGVNGSQNAYVAIDTVSYAVPEPSSMVGSLLIGGFGAAYRLRKAKKAQA